MGVQLFELVLMDITGNSYSKYTETQKSAKLEAKFSEPQITIASSTSFESQADGSVVFKADNSIVKPTYEFIDLSYKIELKLKKISDK